MKKIFLKTIIIMLFLIITSGLSQARREHRSGPIYDTVAGEEFSFTGEIIDIKHGHGIVIATASEDVIVFGLGPKRYWKSFDLERPAIGDEVYVEGYSVDYFGRTRNIAFLVMIGEEEIELRDRETGLPLWSR